MNILNKNILTLSLAAALGLGASSLLAQETAAYKNKPKGHEQNQQLAASAHAGNRKKFAGDTNRLVLPGLVADQQKKRVEVLVESTRLSPNAACEFTIIGETSDHGYEALLIAFAQPSDVHRALQFIGTEPGASFDPESLRFWAKGEAFVLSLRLTNEPPVRLENLLRDRRTGQTLPETGFLFTGSRRVPAPGDPQKTVYAADEYQPKSIVSLFNSTYSVLEVPYSAPKAEVYANIIVNSDRELPEGALLTLVIEPLHPDGSPRVKDLVLQVQAGSPPTDKPLTGMERLASLSFQLKDDQTVLNPKPTLISVVMALAALDRNKLSYYITVSFDDKVELGQADALAKILATIDADKGVRIEPPPAGQLSYRAFLPDQLLLDREARFYHPWELSLSAKDGRAQGKLLRIDSVWKPGATASVLEVNETSVAGPQDFRQELEAEVARTRKANTRPRPPVIMVFAPATLSYGQLTAILAPALPTHKMIHVYLDTPLPPVPLTKP